MATIAQNLETIKDGLDDIKENLGLSQNASLANVVTKSASVVEPTGTLQITSNDTYDVTNYASAEVSVSGGGGADLSEYFDNRVYGSLSGKEYACVAYLVKKLPDNLELYSSATTTLNSAFAGMKGLITATLFNTSQINDMRKMFQTCNALRDVPVYDTSNLRTDLKAMENMFSQCNNLSDTSLDNILQMCINAPSGMPGRNLGVLGLTSTYYPTAKIQSLPHYSQFTAVNWSIGY